MKNEVWTHGYNSCLHVAISALNHLSSHSRPAGGQEAYNAEHLLQIADEIKRTIAHNVKAVADGDHAQSSLTEQIPVGYIVRNKVTGAIADMHISTVRSNAEAWANTFRPELEMQPVYLSAGAYTLTSTDGGAK